MKQTTKAAILAASITLAASLLLSSLVRQQAKAAEIGGGEQYKIISLAAAQSFQQSEQELNKLGADGWKVRTGVGNVLVLAK